MGGTGIAIYDPLLINLNNPASYSSVFSQRFTMQTGAIHTTKLLQTPTQDQMVNSTKFNYILFSFLFEFLGIKFWSLPYSGNHIIF